ncbi:hypothetical protein [Streptomyces sp. NBC_01205]|uniref:hypothetical protein n=1 Tax=Streptomyces sp. NBC_01205 TaxID=2903771 RepID=UPI002E167042|nr:hypothetical protein OG573_29050 [Streptomyces sp. NBC_01205]
MNDRGIALHQYLTLVRSGSVTLAFRSDAIDTEDFGGVPQEIVTGQWEKFATGLAAPHPSPPSAPASASSPAPAPAPAS